MDTDAKHWRPHNRGWWAAIIAATAVVLAIGTSVVAVRQLRNTDQIGRNTQMLAQLEHQDRAIENAAVAASRKIDYMACQRVQALRDRVNHNSRVIYNALVNIALSRAKSPQTRLPYRDLLRLAETLGAESRVDCRHPKLPKFTPFTPPRAVP